MPLVSLAHSKAWGAFGMGFGTREVMDRAEKHSTFFTAAAAATEGRIIPSPGGVLIRNAEGFVIGAVGVAGNVGPQAGGFHAVTGASEQR